MMSPIVGVGVGVGFARRAGAGGAAFAGEFLLRDDFTTDEAAPLTSPRTAEPGPGTLTITDTAEQFSISGGKLRAASSAGGPKVYGGSHARVAGRAVGLDFIGALHGGWSFAAGITANDAIVLLTAGFFYARHAGANVLLAVIPIDKPYQIAVSMRDSGYFHWARGGAYARWTLLYASVAGSETRTAAAGNLSGAANTWEQDYFRVVDVPALMVDDYAIATNHIATTIDDDTTTSVPDTIVEHTIVAQTGVTQEIDVRRTDADNRWIIRMDQAGGTLKIIQRVAGTETERASTAQTWTDATSYRVVVLFSGIDLRVFVNNVARGSYVHASFNSAATGVRVSHAGSNLACWPVHASSTVSNQLSTAFTGSALLFSFGYVSDMHRGDKDPAFGRNYRDADAKLSDMAEQLNQHALSFVIANGDLIDSVDVDDVAGDFAAVVSELDNLTAPVYYSLGNHEVTHVDKATAMAALGMSESYYSYDAGGYHFVVLDACYRSDDDDDPYDTGNFTFTTAYVPPAQRTWLAADLAATNLPVIVFCHQRLDDTGDYSVDNAAAVRTILEAGDVRACFHGHQHINAKTAINGIAYYTVEALIDSAYPVTAYGIVHVYADGTIAVRGFGGAANA